MGFLFTLKRSLVVKAPDLSSLKCLVVTNVLVCFLFVFFMRNLPFLYIIFSFGTWVFTSPISSSPPSSSLPRPLRAEPHFFAGENAISVFHFVLVFPRNLFGGRTAVARGGVTEPNLGAASPHTPTPGAPSTSPPMGDPPDKFGLFRKQRYKNHTFL